MSVPEIGATAFDSTTDSVGVVMAVHPNQVFLRPIGGGVEWESRPQQVRPATVAEEVSAKNAAANRRTEAEAVTRAHDVIVPPCVGECAHCERAGRRHL